MLLKSVIFLCVFGGLKAQEPTPLVLWHGMGDSCCFSFSLGSLMSKINDSIPGIYMHSLQIGSSLINDVENSYFRHPDKQIEEACEIIKSDPKLQDGFNAIGLSQGAQFLRALVQRCPSAQVKNLISLGGQHQGVYGLPNCEATSTKICDYIRKLLNSGAYLSFVQKLLVQATYWHDPLAEQTYKNASTFLSDINNEVTINQNYIENLQNLENFVMVRFDNDTMVEPVESEWFGFYKPGQSILTETLEESNLYQNDQLGLRTMNEQGKLHFLSTPGNHLRFEWAWFQDNIIEPFLRN